MGLRPTPRRLGLLVSSTDHRPEREWTFRFYEEKDREQVVALFKKQNLNVYLPIPKEDPAVAVGMVAERDGKIRYALFPRMTYEVHLVADPDEKMQPYAIRRLTAMTEGAAMELGAEMNKVRFPYPTDAIAFVPNEMPDMIEFCKSHLGFIDEAVDRFKMLVKRLGS